MKKLNKLLAIFLALLLLAGCAKQTAVPEDGSAASADPRYEGRVVVPGSEEVTEPTITVSAPAGIYTADERPASVTLSTDSGYRICYTTTTCTVPEATSEEAKGEIRLPYKATNDGVTECAIIRAALFDGSEQVGQCYTFTYLSAPEGRFTTPVFSLVSEPDGLYGYEEGILVEGKARADAKKYGNPKGWVLGNTNANYYNSGIEWERATSIEFSESGSGAYILSSNGGIRVNGGWTRANTQKSLKIFSRKSYTPSHGTFTVDLFPGYRDPNTGRTDSFANTILLRGGSNNEGNNVIATPVQIKLCEGTSQIIPAIRPVTEFINGEYRGVFMLIEDYDADFFEAHFGVPEEDLIIISGSYENYGGSMWTIDTGEDSDLSDFVRALQKIATVDGSRGNSYDYADGMIDMRNFIEYMCIQLYCGNSDWPDNNLRVVRVKEDAVDENGSMISDGKYRFLLKDLDLSFGNGHNVAGSPYDTIRGNSTLMLKNVFNNLMKNETFANRVYMYFCTLATAVFDPMRVQQVIGDFTLAMSDEMDYTTKTLKIAGGSLGTWQANVSGLRSYANKRVDTVLNATTKASGKKLATLNIEVTGDGEAELGWFAATNGEVRQYPQSTTIPLTLSNDAEVTVEGGMYKNDVLILTSPEAKVSIVFGEKEAEKTADTVVINEVAVRGVDEPFIELYNGSDEAVDLDGWSIGTKKMQSLDGQSIPAHGYLTLGTGCDLPILFGLNQNYTLTLEKNGREMDSAPLSEVHKSIHEGRYPDGGSWITLYTSELTPGAANEILPAFDMVGDHMHDTILVCGVSTEVSVKMGLTTLLPISMLKTPFKYCRDVYPDAYAWIKDNDSEKMSIGDLKETLESYGVVVRFIEERNLLIIQ